MSNLMLNACRPAQMPPTAKNVLMAIADRADDDGNAWPSIPGLCEATCFSRTAVIDAQHWLESNGLIQVKKATGKNNRFTINTAAVAFLVANSAGRPTRPPAEPVRQADGSASRTPPVRQTDPHPSASRTTPVREADPNHQEPPLNHQEPKARTRAATFDAASIDLPPEIDRAVWSDWVADRRERHKPITSRAAEGQLQVLMEGHRQGHNPADLIKKAIASGWQGFYLPKSAVAVSRHAGFAQRNYQAGVSDDGSLQ